MATEWYFEENGERQGPIEEDNIQEIISQGRITAETLVWHDPLEDWVMAGDSELSAMFTGEPDAEDIIPITPKESEPAAQTISGKECANCNRQFSADDLVEIDGVPICAECKPVYLRKLQEGGSVNSVHYHYGGFWIRFLAIFIDGLITGIVQFPLGLFFGFLLAAFGSAGREPNVAAVLIIQMLNMATSLLVPLLYNAIFLVKKGATPGKMALGLRVINADGTEKISWGKAIGRHFAKILNGFTLNIGYMMAGWDSEKRGLHDRLCATRVIYKR